MKTQVLCISKKMGAVLKTLWEHCPGILSSLQGVRVPPYKDKKILGVWMEGNTEKCIFEPKQRNTGRSLALG